MSKTGDDSIFHIRARLTMMKQLNQMIAAEVTAVAADGQLLSAAVFLQQQLLW